jgi:hypothetical protein
MINKTMERRCRHCPPPLPPKDIDILLVAKILQAYDRTLQDPQGPTHVSDGAEMLRFYDQPVRQREMMARPKIARVKVTTEALRRQLRRFNIRLHF